MSKKQVLPGGLEKISFDEIKNWANDNHSLALKGMLRFCEKTDAVGGLNSVNQISVQNFSKTCSEASTLLSASAGSVRLFFEKTFTPFRVSQPGFVTGYFEPEYIASLTKTSEFTTPLLKKPRGLRRVTDKNRPKNWPDNLSHGRLVDGALTEMPDRAAIMSGALEREGLEFVWLKSPIEAFYIHIQGSARLRLTDGSVMRVGYASKTGHPYSSIARSLVQRGEGTPEDFTMEGTIAWLEAHPEQQEALFKVNRSYIFFREVTEISTDQGPIGGAGLSLVSGRSLAIDPAFFPYGALIFVEADFQDNETTRPFSRLMIADDTGSAIKGAARGDIFVGSGKTAGKIAGDIRHSATFTVLVPNSVLAKTGP